MTNKEIEEGFNNITRREDICPVCDNLNGVYEKDDTPGYRSRDYYERDKCKCTAEEIKEVTDKIWKPSQYRGSRRV